MMNRQQWKNAGLAVKQQLPVLDWVIFGDLVNLLEPELMSLNADNKLRLSLPFSWDSSKNGQGLECHSTWQAAMGSADVSCYQSLFTYVHRVLTAP